MFEDGVRKTWSAMDPNMRALVAGAEQSKGFEPGGSGSQSTKGGERWVSR